jgi:hypothetical protein
VRVILEILSGIAEEVVGIGGLVDERFSGIVTDIYAESGPLAKTLFT